VAGLLEARLLQLTDPPGVIDSAAVKAEIARKLRFPDVWSPLLLRLLARASGDEAGGLPGGALPLAAPFAFGGGEPVAAATTVPQTPPTAPPSAGLPPPEAPSRLVRVARRARPPDTGPAVPIPRGTALARSPAATPGNGAAATAAASRQVNGLLDSGDDTAGWIAVPPLATLPTPPTGGTVSSDQHPDRLPMAPSRTRAPPRAFAFGSASPAAPDTAALGASPPIAGPNAPRSALAAAVAPLPRAAPLPVTTANRMPSARGAVVSELRRSPAPQQPEAGTSAAPIAGGAVAVELPLPPRPQPPLVMSLPIAEAPGRSEIAARVAPAEGNTTVSELPRRAHPAAPLVLRARSVDTPHRAAALGPDPSPMQEPALPERMQIVPSPARSIGSSPPAALSGGELDRFADKVARIIARRVAVERERRGR
jgi:hypothetical protein